jgi:hypothetical protein
MGFHGKDELTSSGISRAPKMNIGSLESENFEKGRLETVNILKLKSFAYEKLPQHSLLREFILSEKEELPISEFIVKIDVWLKLLRVENINR